MKFCPQIFIFFIKQGKFRDFRDFVGFMSKTNSWVAEYSVYPIV